MSEIYSQQKKYQIENSPHSESFTLPNGDKVKGIFDRAILVGKSDNGGVKSKTVKTRILVAEIPSPALVKEDVIIRDLDGTSFKFKESTVDDQGIPLLWLI